jgi:hypothetical protein
MLNELMGPNRNEEINRSMLNFRVFLLFFRTKVFINNLVADVKDDDVCKYYLQGFCPHDEFVNTKADLGIIFVSLESFFNL